MLATVSTIKKISLIVGTKHVQVDLVLNKNQINALFFSIRVGTAPTKIVTPAEICIKSLLKSQPFLTNPIGFCMFVCTSNLSQVGKR